AADHAGRARVRRQPHGRAGRRRARGRVPADLDRDRQVLAVQARPAADRRGARVPRRGPPPRGGPPRPAGPAGGPPTRSGRREAPLNAIWEGAGNVICLDVLRAMTREPATFEALRAELRLAAGADRRLDALVADIETDVVDRSQLEARARRFVEKLALALQAS